MRVQSPDQKPGGHENTDFQNPAERPPGGFVFQEAETRALKDNGGVIYPISGTTLLSQIVLARNQNFRIHSPFVYQHRYPWLRTEVAIFPDEEAFFVPRSERKSTYQEKVDAMKKDEKRLKQKLGVNGFSLIAPQVDNVVEVVLKHQEETGQRLLGDEGEREDVGETVTATDCLPIYSTIPHRIIVGPNLGENLGLQIDAAQEGSIGSVGLMRFIVPSTAAAMWQGKGYKQYIDATSQTGK